MANANKEAIPAGNNTAATGGIKNSADRLSGTLTTADRTNLIQRMLREAFDESSALAANLQVNGGDLLEMSLVLKKAIMDAAKSSGDISEFKDLQPFFDTYVKLCRQADRVLRLKHEIVQSPRAASLAAGKYRSGGRNE